MKNPALSYEKLVKLDASGRKSAKVLVWAYSLVSMALWEAGINAPTQDLAQWYYARSLDCDERAFELARGA